MRESDGRDGAGKKVIRENFSMYKIFFKEKIFLRKVLNF